MGNRAWSASHEPITVTRSVAEAVWRCSGTFIDMIPHLTLVSHVSTVPAGQSRQRYPWIHHLSKQPTSPPIRQTEGCETDPGGVPREDWVSKSRIYMFTDVVYQVLATEKPDYSFQYASAQCG